MWIFSVLYAVSGRQIFQLSDDAAFETFDHPEVWAEWGPIGIGWKWSQCPVFSALKDSCHEKCGPRRETREEGILKTLDLF
jgi:hypothetical protein